MILRVPSYYRTFSCIADQCQDSCCIGWEIDIDEDTFSYYQSVEGELGARLTEHMVTEDGINSFTLKPNGWCPFLNGRKLCDICIELGEEALSEVCTEYPRFTMEYGNVREKILCLSCEEVGRIIFSTDEKIRWEEIQLEEDYEENLEDEGDASWMEQVREHAVAILQDRSKSIFARAAEYLCYCESMQVLLGEADRGFCQEMDVALSEKALEGCVSASDKAEAYRDFLLRLERFEQLEVLDDVWEQEKKELRETFSEENYLEAVREFVASQREREYEYEHLLVYFTFRYFMRAYYDDNLMTKAQYAVASLLMIRDMDVMRFVKKGTFNLTDRIETAKIYAKEVEHSEENMETLAEDFQFEEVFRKERLQQALMMV